MAKTKFEIVRKIASWDLNNGETFEFNIVKWYNNSPKYDLRRWVNGEPGKGAVIPDGILEELYDEIGNELDLDESYKEGPDIVESHTQEPVIGELKDNPSKEDLESAFVELGKTSALLNGMDAGNRNGYAKGLFDGLNNYEYDDDYYEDDVEIVIPESYSDYEDNPDFVEGYKENFLIHYGSYYVRGYAAGYDEGMAERENSESEELGDDIDFRDFFVYGSYGGCRNPEHTDKEKVRAQVSIVKQIGGVGTIEFDAVYCRECGVYYISQSEYERITRSGRVLCQLISEKKYNEMKKNGFPGEVDVISVLYRFGYNVSEKDGYSDSYRQSILSAAIESGVISKKGAINHLRYLIKLNEKKSNLTNAREKWNKDIAYLKGVDYDSANEKRIVGVKRIIK